MLGEATQKLFDELLAVTEPDVLLCKIAGGPNGTEAKNCAGEAEVSYTRPSDVLGVGAPAELDSRSYWRH